MVPQSPFVIGHPIKHSRSPLIHNAWIERYGLNGHYQAFDVHPDQLALFVAQKAQDETCPGGNVTLPHKESIVPFLDRLTDRAKRIGAVNTLYKPIETRNCFIGDNTDAYGFTANLDACAKIWRQGKTALVVGAGGASRAVLVALLDVGYKKIFLLNRTVERATVLADEFEPNRIEAGSLENFSAVSQSSDIIINTSSMGLEGDLPDTITMAHAQPDTLVTDIVYGQDPTAFLARATEQGLPTVDGFGMLLHQAVPGFTHWFGLKPDVDKTIHHHALTADLPSPVEHFQPHKN